MGRGEKSVAGAGVHRLQEEFRGIRPHRHCGGKKSAPRRIILGGGEAGAGRSLDIKGEKLSTLSQNSTGVTAAIFTFSFNVDKAGFMIL